MGDNNLNLNQSIHHRNDHYSTTEENKFQDKEDKNLKCQLDNALNDLETIKNSIREIKSSRTLNPKALVQTKYNILSNLEQRNLNEDNHRQEDNYSMCSGYNNHKNKTQLDILNDFKATLKETDNYLPQRIRSSASHSKNNSELNRVQSQGNEWRSPRNQNVTEKEEQNLSGFINRISNNSIKDELDRLRIANVVLNKSNLDLKYQNKLMQMELENYKNSAIFKNSNQMDENLNQFIQNLKIALNSSQMTNQELNEIIADLQNKNATLANDNKLTNEQHVLEVNEIEILNKKFSEIKIENEQRMNENSKLKNELSQLTVEINEKDEKLNAANEKINNLINLNETFNENKSDNNEAIENLKTAVEMLKKANAENEKEKMNLISKVETLTNELNAKGYEIDKANDKINFIEEEKGDLLSEIKKINEESKSKTKSIEDLQQNFKKSLGEIDKLKNKLGVLNITLEEKNQTVTNLKASLNFLTQTIEEYRNENESLKKRICDDANETSRFNNSHEMLEKRLKDCEMSSHQMKLAYDELKQTKINIEGELNEKMTKLAQVEFDHELTVQKVNDQNEVITELRQELMINKRDKINEEFTVMMRSTDEKIKKINELSEQCKTKSIELDQMKGKYDDMLKNKDEKIKELNNLIQKLQTKDKENETEMLNQLRLIKTENEKLSKEIKAIKDSHAMEKINIIKERDKLQEEYNNLATNYNKLEKTLKQKQKENPEQENRITNKKPSTQIRIDTTGKYLKDNSTQIKQFISSPREVVQIPQDAVNIRKISDMKTMTSILESTNSETKYIFTLLDSSRVLSFDLIRSEFKTILYEDKANFNMHYNVHSRITINMENGLLIITGRDNKKVFFYNNSHQVMISLPDLNTPHMESTLVYNKTKKTLYCLAGRNSKVVEKLSFDRKDMDEEWRFLPECLYDRANCGAIILNDKYLYMMFGYSNNYDSYINTVEKLNLSLDFNGSKFRWEEVYYHSPSSLSLFLKSFILVKSPKFEEVLIFGGYDGLTQQDNKRIISFNYFKNEFSEIAEKNVSTGISLQFFNENSPVAFYDELYESYLGLFDNSLNVHIFQNSFAKYKIIKF